MKFLSGLLLGVIIGFSTCIIMLEKEDMLMQSQVRSCISAELSTSECLQLMKKENEL
tara:strand:+ start:319 stop:489 length:171 start_codon:yes stop_codon:yes gene_type:complete